MGWKTYVPTIEYVATNSTTGAHEVYPKLLTQRSSNNTDDAGGPPPSVPTVYAPDALPSGGTGAYTNAECTGALETDLSLDGEFTVNKLLPRPFAGAYNSWTVPFENGSVPATISTWLASALEKEVLEQSGNTLELPLLDRTYTFEFFASDTAFEPDGMGGWDTGAAGEDGVYQELNVGTDPVSIVTYKNGPGPMVFPQLRPRWYGANSLQFLFPVNVNTVESTATIYIRYKQGQHATVPSTYDGQVEVAGSAKGTMPETYSATLTGLAADTLYTVWVYAERLTNGDTSGNGPLSYINTEQTDTYTITDVNVSITTSPRNGHFRFNGTATRVQRSKSVYIPRTYIQVVKQSDYALSGWTDATLIKRSPYIGPFYPEEVRATGAAGTYVLAEGESYGPATSASVNFGGTVDVTDLTQSTSYRYRLVVELPSGAVYPAEGTFATPDFDRQRRSPRFTLGAY